MHVSCTSSLTSLCWYPAELFVSVFHSIEDGKFSLMQYSASNDGKHFISLKYLTGWASTTNTFHFSDWFKMCLKPRIYGWTRTRDNIALMIRYRGWVHCAGWRNSSLTLVLLWLYTVSSDFQTKWNTTETHTHNQTIIFFQITTFYK